MTEFEREEKRLTSACGDFSEGIRNAVEAFQTGEEYFAFAAVKAFERAEKACREDEIGIFIDEMAEKATALLRRKFQV